MSRDPLDHFEDRWRRWARRPPATPPEEAARRLAAALPDRSPYAHRWLAAAAVALAALGAWLVLPFDPPWQEPPPSEALSSDVTPPPLADGVVLLWIDPETPLYLSLPQPKGAL